jgi:hypothetical protein
LLRILPSSSASPPPPPHSLLLPPLPSHRKRQSRVPVPTRARVAGILPGDWRSTLLVLLITPHLTVLRTTLPPFISWAPTPTSTFPLLLLNNATAIPSCALTPAFTIFSVLLCLALVALMCCTCTSQLCVPSAASSSREFLSISSRPSRIMLSFCRSYDSRGEFLALGFGAHHASHFNFQQTFHPVFRRRSATPALHHQPCIRSQRRQHQSKSCGRVWAACSICPGPPGRSIARAN